MMAPETHTLTKQGRVKCRVSRQCGPAARVIVDEILKRERISWERLVSTDVSRPLVYIRHEVMAALFATGIYSMPEIGRFLNRRNHTTVLQGIQRHRRKGTRS